MAVDLILRALLRKAQNTCLPALLSGPEAGSHEGSGPLGLSHDPEGDSHLEPA